MPLTNKQHAILVGFSGYQGGRVRVRSHQLNVSVTPSLSNIHAAMSYLVLRIPYLGLVSSLSAGKASLIYSSSRVMMTFTMSFILLELFATRKLQPVLCIPRP